MNSRRCPLFVGCLVLLAGVTVAVSFLLAGPLAGLLSLPVAVGCVLLARHAYRQCRFQTYATGLVRAHDELLESNRELQQEIQARKEMAEELSKNRRQFEAIFQNARDAILIADDRLVLVDANAAACEMLGYPLKEMCGLAVTHFAPPDQREYAQGLWIRLLRQGWLQGEQKLLTHSGGTVEVEFRAAANILPGVHLAILRDVTERKRTLLQIRQYNENLETLLNQHGRRIRELERQRSENERLAAQGQMAAQIAHEINNPLAGIKNAFRLVRRAVPENHPHFPFVQRIDDEIDRIMAIVQQMFGIYGKKTPPAEGLLLEEIVLHVVGMLETTGLIRKIRLRVEIPEHIRLKLPKAPLIQILMNLLQNAVEASEDGGTVELSADDRGDSVRLAVRDEGAGIPPEIGEQVFEAFYSTKTPTGPREGGMGMGLNICRNIVHNLDGMITYRSMPGEGTVFEITLPKILHQNQETHSHAPASTHSSH